MLTFYTRVAVYFFSKSHGYVGEVQIYNAAMTIKILSINDSRTHVDTTLHLFL